MVKRFGKLITAAFIIMGIGIVAFLLVIPLYGYFGVDTDVLGLIILDAGVVILLIGIIRRKKLHGFKLVALAVLASILSIPVLFLVVTLIYYLITGKQVGG